MSNPHVIYVESTVWADVVAAMVMATIVQTCHVRGSYSVMLTGGRSAAILYDAWSAMQDFDQLRDVKFYFGDERCVPSDHPESNYGLAMRTLFQRGVPPGCEVIRIAGEQTNDETAAAYEAQLPDNLDVMLLSMGEDGHIASLFPQSPALLETCRGVVSVSAPKSPTERLTITPPVIARATQLFVLALGPAKAAVYSQAKLEPQNFAALPARLVLSATWFLDTKPTD